MNNKQYVIQSGTVPSNPNPDGTHSVTSQSIYNQFMSVSDDSEVPPLESLLKKYQNKKDKALPSVDTALRRAAFEGNVEDIEYLVTHYNANINATSENGNSALDWAYTQNQMNVFNTLCWLKADQTELKKLLWKYVTDTEEEFPVKDLALCRAAERGNLDDITKLVRKYKANIIDNRYGNPRKLGSAHPEVTNLLKQLLDAPEPQKEMPLTELSLRTECITLLRQQNIPLEQAMLALFKKYLNSGVTKLDLNGVQIGKNTKFLQDLFSGLKHNKNIVSLSLASCGLVGTVSTILPRLVCSNPVLRELDLSRNEFTEGDLHRILEIIEKSTSLKSLSLAGYILFSDHLAIMNQLLEKNKLLTELKLEPYQLQADLEPYQDEQADFYRQKCLTALSNIKKLLAENASTRPDDIATLKTRLKLCQFSKAEAFNDLQFWTGLFPKGLPENVREYCLMIDDLYVNSSELADNPPNAVPEICQALEKLITQYTEISNNKVFQCLNERLRSSMLSTKLKTAKQILKEISPEPTVTQSDSKQPKAAFALAQKSADELNALKKLLIEKTGLEWKSSLTKQCFWAIGNADSLTFVSVHLMLAGMHCEKFNQVAGQIDYCLSYQAEMMTAEKLQNLKQIIIPTQPMRAPRLEDFYSSVIKL